MKLNVHRISALTTKIISCRLRKGSNACKLHKRFPIRARRVNKLLIYKEYLKKFTLYNTALQNSMVDEWMSKLIYFEFSFSSSPPWDFLHIHLANDNTGRFLNGRVIQCFLLILSLSLKKLKKLVTTS